MNRKSSWRPISAGTASLRSSTKPGAAVAARAFVTLRDAIADPSDGSSERLGADQLLAEQHRDRLAALERHGQRRAGRGDHVLRPLDLETDDAHGFEHGL